MGDNWNINKAELLKTTTHNLTTERFKAAAAFKTADSGQRLPEPTNDNRDIKARLVGALMMKDPRRWYSMKTQSARATIHCLRTLEWVLVITNCKKAGKREIIARYGLALGLNRKRGYLNHYKTVDEAKDALVKLVRRYRKR